MDNARTLKNVKNAIHAFCLDCVEVKNEDTNTCKNELCQLYRFRNGNEPKKMNDKKRELIEKWTQK